MADILVELDQADHKEFDLGQTASMEMDVGDVRAVYLGGIDYEEDPVDSGFVWYNEETKKYQTKEVDLTSRVEKITEETTTPQVYAKNKDGSQTMLNAVQYYADDRNGLARFINGNLVVNTPTEDGHATHKKYVDENFVSKETPEDGINLYGSDTSGEKKFNVTSNGVIRVFADQILSTPVYQGVPANGQIPIATIGGAVNVGTPTQDGHAVNKKYADDNFVAKRTMSTGYSQVYAKAPDGTQTFYNIASDATGGAIAQRDNNGRLVCNTPSTSAHVANKGYVDDKFNGSNKAVSFVNYSAMITSLNTLGNTSYSVGQNIMIVTLEVPDLWVSEISETSVAYTYVSDDDFVNELTTNGSVQVGYYNLSALETQKVDLTEYVKNTDYPTDSKAGVVKAWEIGGIQINSSNGNIYLAPANEQVIINRTPARAPITVENMDFAFKTAFIDNKQEWTDEEKSKASNLIGAVSQVEYSKDQTFADGSDAGVIGRLYMRFRDNTENSIVANCQNTKYSVPVRDSTGNFYVGNPTQLYHTVNLISVTALQGTEAPTESTTAIYVGQIYQDTTNNTTYQCTAIDKTNKVYTWVKLIRETDYAIDNGQAGIVKTIGSTYGVRASTNGLLFVDGASKPQILDKGSAFKPITPNTIDYAVKVGMTTNTETWSDEEKASARALIGAIGANSYATDEVGGTLRGVAAFGFKVDTYGRGQIVGANNDEIAAKTNEFKPIVPKNLDYSIVQGLTNNSTTLTEEQKTAIQTWLGITVPQVTILEEV